MTTTSFEFRNEVSFYLSIAALVLSIILGLIRVSEHFTREGFKVELVRAVPIESGSLHVAFRVRNKGDKPTSLRRAYHESGAWGRFLYRLIGTFFHEELMLRECDTLALYNMLGGRTKTELESMGTPVTLPLRILGGDAKNFHTFLQSGDPEDKHHLVIHTTHKTYVKKLHSELFQKGSRAVIMDIFTD